MRDDRGFPFWNVFVAAAEAAIARLREQHGPEWAEKDHNRGFVIREATVETDFQIPDLPKPRDKYFAVGTESASKKAKPIGHGSHGWHGGDLRTRGWIPGTEPYSSVFSALSVALF